MEEIKQEWEEMDARDLGMCCPGCDCGHCEIRRSLVNKIVDLAVSKEREDIKNILWQVREDWRNDGQIQVLDTADYLINLINTK